MQIIIREPVLLSLERREFVITSPNSLIFREDLRTTKDKAVFRGTQQEGVFICLYTFLRNLYSFEPTSPKTPLSDVLELPGQTDVLQVLTALERAVLNSLQSGRQLNLRHRALLEDSVPHSTILVVLVCPEHLQSLVEFHGLEITALRKRALSYFSERSRKLDVAEIFALSESMLLNYLQRGWKPDRLQCAPPEALLPDVLEGVRQCDALKTPTVLERICANFP